MFRFVLRRVASGLIVLVLIAYFALFVQRLAGNARQQRTVPLSQTVVQAGQDVLRFATGLARGELGTYAGSGAGYGGGSDHLVRDMLDDWILNSLGLLLLAMFLGGFLGALVGIIAAAVHRPGWALGILLLSIVGISTPSFFLGVLLQYLEITLYRHTGVRLVPVGGYGWDEHMVLPVIVLAARPIAQVARLTYVKAGEILGEDYVRTAHAKGLPGMLVWWAHIAPNTASTVLTAMGTSLRFSLSSLPVVEFIFGWPGAGRALLELLRASSSDGAAALVVAMGALFIITNLLLDVAYRLLDPRLREAQAQRHDQTSGWEWFRSLLGGILAALRPSRWREKPGQIAAIPELLSQGTVYNAVPSSGQAEDDLLMHQARRRARWRAWAHNPALIAGLVMGALLIALVVWGPSLSPYNAYVSSPMLEIGGQQVKPPVEPGADYLLGTDAQGRDVLSLLLVGARRTFAIAFLAMVSRLLVGAALGFISGWFAGSRLDHGILGLAEILASFPALLLATLVVYAIGIRQGLSAFVVALAVVGWGEVMQMVRSQVLAIKPLAYIEGAVATGLTEGRILAGHVLPNVWPTIVSLAFLEMGGVLMMLGELGFLGVFIGGGFAAEGEGLPTLVYYDVPEWSVMLAHSWRSFRSFPWATLYPALAFFASILGFTLLGEGIRQLSERLTLSFRSWFNRYTFACAAILLLLVYWTFESTGFYARYAPAAASFNVSRAVEDIGYLAGDTLQGRLSGTLEADLAANWIASEFERLALQPGGQEGGYFQHFRQHYRDIVGVPSLLLHGPNGERIEARYGQDFGRALGQYDVGGYGGGPVVVVAQSSAWGYMPSVAASDLGITVEELERKDRVVLYLDRALIDVYQTIGRSAQLTMDSAVSARHELPSPAGRTISATIPSALISREMVDRLLVHSGSSVETLLREVAREKANGGLYLPTGWTAELEIPTSLREGVPVRNVIAFWPGVDVALDSEAIVVSAYYDGVGHLPDGTWCPGANDNASGVATMLEMIRILREQDYRPKRTIVFVAWVGGERHQLPDYAYFMRAHPGFSDGLKIVGALEVAGVGAGTGSKAVVRKPTRERLTEVLQQAARKVGTPLSTRDRGLHEQGDRWPLPERSTPSLVVSWSGSDALAHTANDSVAQIDEEKIGQVGRMLSLALMVLAADPSY